MSWKDNMKNAGKIFDLLKNSKGIIANVKAGIETIEFGIERFAEANGHTSLIDEKTEN